MAKIHELKEYFDSLYSFAESISSDYRAIAENDVVVFCAYIIAADNKISPKEVKLLSDFTGIQVDPESLLRIIKQQNWVEFEHSVPMILEGLMIADIEDGKDFDNSRSKDLLSSLVRLANALIEADGKEKIEEQKAARYTDYLIAKAMEKLNKSNSKGKKSSDLNRELENPKPKPTLKSENAKPSKSPQSHSANPDKPVKQAEKEAEAPKPKPASSQPAKKASGEVSIPTTGPTSKMDFWQAFKPYIDQMRHTEFSKVKIKDDDCLDAKATVIVGVYNSILMRVSKNLLRLELYIDTETEAGNLQILDYIKAKIKVPSALKGKIDYERKEGRRAQRVCVSFPGFALTNRSCWGKYITEIMNVADDFFDAVEAPMRELISGS